jgi:long-chain acyl-CoA synthetase
MDMEKMGKLTLPEMLKASFTKFAENTSLVFAGEENRTYAQLEDDIKMAVRQLKSIGISKGDKVAILSANMPNWGIAYFAIGSIGAVVVPILPDFHPNEIRNIIKHSEATAIYVSDGLAHKLLIEEYPQVQVIWIEDFTLHNAGACPPVEEQEAKKFCFRKC